MTTATLERPARETAIARPAPTVHTAATPQPRPAAVLLRAGRARIADLDMREPVAVPDGAREETTERHAAAPLPDPTFICCTVVRAAVEVFRGERTVSQLARWVSPEIFDTIARRAGLCRRAHGARRRIAPPVQILRTRVIRLGDDTAEAAVIIEDAGRVRAAAARLEARRGLWRVVALEIG